MASILLLFQISIITSHPVVNKGEQKQDVDFYRDNSNSSVIREENALHRNVGSSDRRNDAVSTFLSLLSKHARVVRSTHGCVKHEPIRKRMVSQCGDAKITTVRCEKTSLACYGRGKHSPRCKEITITCPLKRNKVLVTGCECL